jgi:hypothetical protein
MWNNPLDIEKNDHHCFQIGLVLPCFFFLGEVGLFQCMYWRYHTVGYMALEVVGQMEGRGQANMPPRSLLPRLLGVGKKISPVILRLLSSLNHLE